MVRRTTRPDCPPCHLVMFKAPLECGGKETVHNSLYNLVTKR